MGPVQIVEKPLTDEECDIIVKKMFVDKYNSLHAHQKRFIAESLPHSLWEVGIHTQPAHVLIEELENLVRIGYANTDMVRELTNDILENVKLKRTRIIDSIAF